MDTSNSFQSPRTVNFVVGDGHGFNEPSSEDWADILMKTSAKLRAAGLIEHIVGQRLLRDGTEYISAKHLPPRPPQGHALNRERVRVVHHVIYTQKNPVERVRGWFILQDKGHWYWMLETFISHHILEIKMLDHDSIAEVLGREEIGKNVGLDILKSLDHIFEIEVLKRRVRLDKMEEAYYGLNSLVRRAKLVSEG